MIYTLTTNPAVDMNISANNPIEYSVVNRTKNAKYTANGKGLNVSNTLKYFGIDSKILGFFGGFTGDYIIQETQAKGFDVIPVIVDDTTRVNVFLNDNKGEFNFVNEGSFVDDDAQNEMLKIIDEKKDIDVLSISGSLAKGMEESFYDKVFGICIKKNIKVVLDISSKKLKELLQYKPFLIKPNDEEIEDIFGWNLNNNNDFVNALHKLYDLGAQHILLTCGENGMYYYGGDKVYKAFMDPVKVESTACAGDASLAAFMSVFLKDNTKIEKALTRACATGANVVESKGLGNFSKVDSYLSSVLISLTTKNS